MSLSEEQFNRLKKQTNEAQPTMLNTAQDTVTIDKNLFRRVLDILASYPIPNKTTSEVSRTEKNAYEALILVNELQQSASNNAQR